MNWPEFFKNEAISNYIVFILGIFVGILGWLVAQYISRKKPQIVDIVRIEEESVLEIDSNIKQDIVIEYKGSPVNSLYRTEYRILNRGESVIDSVQVGIQVDTQQISDILYCIVLDDLGKVLSGATASNTPGPAGKQEIQVNLDFLNPYSGYKERVVLDVYSSQPFQTLSASGRGRGWTVKYLDQIQYNDDISSTAYTLLSGTMVDKILAIASLVLKKIK
jgi:hypothetical protein